MTPIRRAELEKRSEVLEALIAKAGSVRRAAKELEMDRSSLQRLRRSCRILTAPAPPRTS